MFIIGRKLKMTQVWDDKKEVAPITLVKCAKNKVVEVKSKEKDGYLAVIIETKKLRKEFRLDKVGNGKGAELKKGDEIKITDFTKGSRVKATGVSKGKGFQGVVKRHNFSGGGKTHGHRHDLRQPGSIGSAFPQHVMKGKKMAGRMGQDQVTIKHLTIAEVDDKNNLLKIKGALPGKRGDWVSLILE